MPVISDRWDGLDALFAPGVEIFLAEKAEQVVQLLNSCSEAEAAAMGRAARERVMNGHSASDRAAELEHYLREAMKAAAPQLVNA